jgi:hypothetical protein
VVFHHVKFLPSFHGIFVIVEPAAEFKIVFDVLFLPNGLIRAVPN